MISKMEETGELISDTEDAIMENDETERRRGRKMLNLESRLSEQSDS